MSAVIKNILSTLLAMVLCVSCAQKKSLSPLADWMSENGKIKVLSTIAQIGDLVAVVGGERVDSLILVPANSILTATNS